MMTILLDIQVGLYDEFTTETKACWCTIMLENNFQAILVV